MLLWRHITVSSINMLIDLLAIATQNRICIDLILYSIIILQIFREDSITNLPWLSDMCEELLKSKYKPLFVTATPIFKS